MQAGQYISFTGFKRCAVTTFVVGLSRGGLSKKNPASDRSTGIASQTGDHGGLYATIFKSFWILQVSRPTAKPY